MKKIDIKIPGKEYPVYVGENIFDRLTRLVVSHQLPKNLFVVIDRNIYDLHKTKFEQCFSNLSGKIFVHIFNSSETNKNLRSVEKIYTDLINNGFGRDTLIIAIGGGITGDITGYAAATFSRGVQFVQVPTTLLATIDSSVGGKTGVNFGKTKNIIGAFHQPEFILVDTLFLRTLPEDEIICGVGEIVKNAFLTDQQFFNDLKNNLPKLLKIDKSFTSKIIETSIRYKGDVVAKDEKESGLRKILNLGHTFSHAIEVEQNYNIKHGQAVTIGLVCALELSRQLDLLSEKFFEKYIQLPLLLKDKIVLKKYNSAALYEIMKRDKKGRENKIKFVLLKEIGNLIVDVEAEKEIVIACIERSLKYFSA